VSTGLADRLTREVRDQTFPNARPKDAATLILIDRAQPVPKVLLGRRHHGHKFMPGKFVFPGGRVEPHDRQLPLSSRLMPEVEAQLLRRVERPSPAKARGFAVAAIREVAEETGLLLGRRHGPCVPDGVALPDGLALPDSAWAAFAAAGIEPDLGALRLIARAVTPPRRPKRFDTRFFAADASAIAHRVENVIHPEAELVELTWVPVGEAITLDLPIITQVVLAELEARIAFGFDQPRPIPYYRMVQSRFVRELL
jgi:8-oxo-dGTP pyrophosphatase MutT (NUDIX family)